MQQKYPPPSPPTNPLTIKIISGGGLSGKALSLPEPAYPASAKAVKATGQVTVKVTVDENGNITSAEAISGHQQLRRQIKQNSNRLF